LPIEVKELPEDLAALDVVLSDPELLMPILERFRREVVEDRRAVLTDGRPTIPMETFIRLMVLKARYRWGYRTLVSEVSDSIHLRRFCRISLTERVPDESTIRKLTRRLGAETVSEITRALIMQATRQKRFRVRAVRIDRPSWRRTCATRPTRDWPRTVSRRWPGRLASSRGWSGRHGGGCAIGRGRWAARCGR
jgi:IS5 family transposase